MDKNNEQVRVRQLKVQPRLFERACKAQVVFPEIKLSGKWLQDIGFACGQMVVVALEQNKITITINEE